MLPAKEIEFARRIYKDILNGYSELEFLGKTLYIKHFSDLDFGQIQEFKEEKRREAKSKGLLSEKEKVDLLIENGSWSKAEESDLSNLSAELKNLKLSRSKLYIEAQIKLQTERKYDFSRKTHIVLWLGKFSPTRQ